MIDCIFCKIVRGEIPSQIVHQNDQLTAFRDLHPQAPIHILIVSNKHIDGPLGVTDADVPMLGHVMLTAKSIAQQEGFADSGYRIVTNEGKDGGQFVAHLHFHLLAGRQMGWPPG